MGTVSWIILGVVIVVVIYIIYLYVKNSTLVIHKIDLNKQNASISSTTVAGPTNMSYTYSAWVWVNSWNTTTPHCIVYAPQADTQTAPFLTNGKDSGSIMSTTSYDFALYLDTNSPTLYCTLGSRPNDQSNTIVITNNFPLQSWVYVVVCAQNNLVDCYLNGKLITSQLTNQNNSPPVTPSFKNIYLGNGSNAGSTWDCQLINFQRSPSVVNPQQVWTSYLAGNGQSLFSSLSSYGVQLDLTQNNTITNSYTLF